MSGPMRHLSGDAGIKQIGNQSFTGHQPVRHLSGDQVGPLQQKSILLGPLGSNEGHPVKVSGQNGGPKQHLDWNQYQT